jgi:drug/metabolite transporter (DMT)-like permease
MHQDAARARRRAILCVLGSSASFTVAAALVKFAAPRIPVWEIVLFRSLVAALCLLPMLRGAGGWQALRTRRPLGHAARLAAGLAGMYGSFYGYGALPLATVTALGFSMPIFLALLSFPLLGEHLRAGRAMAVGAGLAGVLVVLRPWQGGLELPLGPAAIVIAGVMFWALAMISIRRMGQAGERNVTIVLLFSLGSSAIAAVACIPVWVTPDPPTFLALAGVGAVSALAQVLMTEGYRSGEATMLAPFEYGAILYTVLLGWLIWGEVPGAWEFTGIAVLVASGLAAWKLESRATSPSPSGRGSG